MTPSLLERFLPRHSFADYDDFKNNLCIKRPDNFNFSYDVVQAWAQMAPDKPALLWVDDALTMQSFTFAEIWAMACRTANVLTAAGIGKGSVVMLMLKQRPEVWSTMVALHMIGAVCIPATYQLTPKDIVYRCEMAGVCAIIVAEDEEVIKHVAEARDKIAVENYWLVGETREGWRDLRADMRAAGEAWTRPTGDAATANDDPMLVYFSSGTTGMPKMVLHDFTYPLGHIVTAKFWNQVENGGRHLTVADSGWAKFGWSKIYGQWICGAEIVAYDTEKFTPATMLRVISQCKLTTFCAPPTVFRFLIKEDLSKSDFSTLKHVTIAGEPLNPEVFVQFRDATGLAPHEGFGQSETTVMLGNFGWDAIKPGSMGKPSPLYDIALIDENGKPVEDGIIGSIVIRNADEAPLGLFRGYWKAPETTAAAWHDGYYDTGDTAWRDSDGYFWFVGRNDDVIKCSGYRIGPFEVESALVEHPAVLECAVTAAPDPLRGQVVKATVVLARGFAPSDQLVKELQNHVKKATAPYKYPRIVEFVEALPKTSSGKIRRAEIRQQDQQGNQA